MRLNYFICLRRVVWPLLLGFALQPCMAVTNPPRAAASHPVALTEWHVGVLLERPYAQYDASGRWLQGANIAVMNRLATQLHRRLVWHPYLSQAALVSALRRHQIDVAPGLVQTPQGLKYELFSEPFLRVPNKVVGLRGRGNHAVDLELLPVSARLSLVGPSALSRFIASAYPVLQLVPQTNERAALALVVARQADYAVVDEGLLAGLLREAAFTQLAVVGDAGYTRLLRIAVRKDQPQNVAQIDAALQQLPPHFLTQVYTRWMLPDYPSLTQQPGFWRDISGLLALLAGVLVFLSAKRARQQNHIELQLERLRHQLELQDAERESLLLPQFTLDHSTVGILWVNWDSRVRYANLAACQLLAARDAADVLGRPISDCYPQLNADRWRELWNRLRSSAAQPNFEAECRRLDGTRLPLDIALSFLRYGTAEYLVVFINDASERHRARAALDESQARLKGIATNVPGLVFRLERAQTGAPVQLAFLSDAATELLGHAPQRIERHLTQLLAWVYPADRPGFLACWQRATTGDGRLNWQGRIQGHKTPLRWVDLKATQRVFENGRMVWDGIAWDISNNKENELSLAASRQSLRELAAHLESAREEEKAHIAREVHDELGQMLTVLRLEMSMCEIGFAHLDPKLHDRLHSMKRLIEQTFQIVRDVASALRPPILDAGIVSAVEWQMRRFEQRSQIPCLVSVPDTVLALADEKAISLFRILQETLTNILRHAEAHSVTVVLQQQASQLMLSISDDGIGFDPSVPREGISFGLAGIRERVLLLGGVLQIDSQAQQGTTLTVTLPIDESEPT